MSIFDFGKKKRNAENEIGLEEKLTSRTSGGAGGLNLVGTFDESKLKRYKYAMEKKALLFDKEDKHGVDFTHMDFVLSTGCNFERGMSNLVAIQLFWKGFYPYLKNIVEAYEKFYDRFRDMIDDQEEVLSKHAELDFKFKWAGEFMKDKGLHKEYDVFIHNKVHEAKMANPAPESRAVEELPSLKQ